MGPPRAPAATTPPGVEIPVVTVFGSEPRGSELYDIPADLRLTSLEAWEMSAIWDGTETIPERL